MNIFLRNIAKVQINPAKEVTLAAIKAKTDLFSFFTDDGDPAELTVNVAAATPGVKNVAGTQINPATEDSLALIKAQSDKLTYTSESALSTTGTAPALASTVFVKDTASTTVGPAEEETTYLWRRMVKLMESQATVDASNTQRISVDSFGAVTGIGLSGDGVPLVTMASDLVRTIPGVSTPTVFMGAGNQYYQDYARGAYARGIRSRLIFS